MIEFMSYPNEKLSFAIFALKTRIFLNLYIIQQIVLYYNFFIIYSLWNDSNEDYIIKPGVTC